MSSRRVPIIRGTKKGRDHFPATLFDGDLGKFDLTTEQACKWLWRVKKWLLSGSLTANFSGSDVDPNGDAYTFLGSATWGITDLPYKMEQRQPNGTETIDERFIISWEGTSSDVNQGNLGAVLAASVSGFSSNGSSYSGTSPILHFSSIAPAGGVAFQIGPGAAWNDPHVQPFIDRGMSGLTPLTGMTLNGEFFSSYDDGIHPGLTLFKELRISMVVGMTSFAGSSVVGSCVIDGVSTSIYGRAFLDLGSFATFGFTSISAGMTATPAEFFPFKTKSGLPVFDTVSGAVVNDPFS